MKVTAQSGAGNAFGGNAPVEPRAEVGALVGVLARRVLGQYELVVPAESGAILDDFEHKGAPVRILDRLIGSLTITENPYQQDLVQRVSKIGGRRDEIASHLRNVYDLLNDAGKRNIRRVLNGMGETP